MTMQSESARASSAAEALFRIDAPNSLPKIVKVVALDAASAAAITGIMRPEWNRANFLTASAFTGAPLARFQAEWKPVSRAENAPTFADAARSDAKPGSTFAERAPAGDAFSMQGWLSDLAGRARNLIDEVATADLVVMIATAGDNVPAAALIGDACRARGVMTTALVRATDKVPDRMTSHTLAQVRPHAMMVVAASADDYIADMLTALRA